MRCRNILRIFIVIIITMSLFSTIALAKNDDNEGSSIVVKILGFFKWLFGSDDESVQRSDDNDNADSTDSSVQLDSEDSSETSSDDGECAPIEEHLENWESIAYQMYETGVAGEEIQIYYDQLMEIKDAIWYGDCLYYNIDERTAYFACKSVAEDVYAASIATRGTTTAGMPKQMAYDKKLIDFKSCIDKERYTSVIYYHNEYLPEGCYNQYSSYMDTAADQANSCGPYQAGVDLTSECNSAVEANTAAGKVFGECLINVATPISGCESVYEDYMEESNNNFRKELYEDCVKANTQVW